MHQLQEQFKATLLAITPEFQDDKGYDIDEPGQANLTVASNWVGNNFNCLAYTVEMPFKDNILLPDEIVGWNDGRSALLGRDTLSAIYQIVDDLR